MIKENDGNDDDDDDGGIMLMIFGDADHVADLQQLWWKWPTWTPMHAGVWKRPEKIVKGIVMWCNEDDDVDDDDDYDIDHIGDEGEKYQVF